jgi:hypothetical protein
MHIAQGSPEVMHELADPSADLLPELSTKV